MYNYGGMFIDLTPYANKRICVAVSGGKDSMALLHYIFTHAREYGITLSALNCEHGIRGEVSERESAFVEAYCGGNCIPVRLFKAQKGVLNSENYARIWRLNCYNRVILDGQADLIATAHHLSDNAETVLFNLARGCALSGMTGITDLPALHLIRPLIACTRGEIDEYIVQNNLPYVTDESNLTDDYTRNKLRHGVLPALEEAVPGALKNIYRFSRLAAEDEEYFDRQVREIISSRGAYGYLVKPCAERVIFRRAVHKIVAEGYQRKDYTAEHFNRLFNLQSAENGKRFEFLGLVAVKESGGVAIADADELVYESEGMPFFENLNNDQVMKYAGCVACAEYGEYSGDALQYLSGLNLPLKTLKYDLDKIPQDAVIRFKRTGDRFTKFGGGSKSLGDYLTDKKVPQSLRAKLPLVCAGSEVLIVGGVEISDKVKITQSTERVGAFVCFDPLDGGK